MAYVLHCAMLHCAVHRTIAMSQPYVCMSVCAGGGMHSSYGTTEQSRGCRSTGPAKQREARLDEAHVCSVARRGCCSGSRGCRGDLGRKMRKETAVTAANAAGGGAPHSRLCPRTHCKQACIAYGNHRTATMAPQPWHCNGLPCSTEAVPPVLSSKPRPPQTAARRPRRWRGAIK